MTYNRKELKSDVPAILVSGRTLVPVRVISETLGATVTFDGAKHQVNIKKGSNTVVLTLGSAKAQKNGKTVELPDGVPATLAESGGAERTMIPLRFVAEGLGAEVDWKENPATAIITQKNSVISVTNSKSNRVITVKTALPAVVKTSVEGKKLYIDLQISEVSSGYDFSKVAAVFYSGGKYYKLDDETVRFEFNLRDSFSLGKNVAVETSSTGFKVSAVREKNDGKIIVVVDPGHGYGDPGATYKGVDEKVVNLEVALQVEEYLKKEGITVIMTRNDDSRITLVERALLANEYQADYYVSIHSNASTTTNTASGIETYIIKKGGKAETLANSVQKAVIFATGAKDRGVKEENLAVLRDTNMPAVLVEMGFLSTEADRLLLATHEYRSILAIGISNGVLNHIFPEREQIPLPVVEKPEEEEPEDEESVKEPEENGETRDNKPAEEPVKNESETDKTPASIIFKPSPEIWRKFGE